MPLPVATDSALRKFTDSKRHKDVALTRLHHESRTRSLPQSSTPKASSRLPGIVAAIALGFINAVVIQRLLSR